MKTQKPNIKEYRIKTKNHTPQSGTLYDIDAKVSVCLGTDKMIVSKVDYLELESYKKCTIKGSENRCIIMRGAAKINGEFPDYNAVLKTCTKDVDMPTTKELRRMLGLLKRDSQSLFLSNGVKLSTENAKQLIRISDACYKIGGGYLMAINLDYTAVFKLLDND